MADGDVDIASLTEDQQLSLQQFTSVTDQDVAAAIPLLRRCQWNVQVYFCSLPFPDPWLKPVQIAIARFFDGEPADPEPQIVDEAPPSRDSRRQETLMNGFHISSSRSSQAAEPAPRVVAQPDGQRSYQPPLLLSILFAPLNLVYGAVSRTLGLFGYLFPFLPRLLSRLWARNTASSRVTASGRRPLSPRDTAARFIREFEEDYGGNSLPFYENGYAQAFDLAKRDLKFLLVILLSPEHDDTGSFVKTTLLFPEVAEFIQNPQNNIILWAGNVQDAEAYQVATALNCTKFPFAGLIVHTPSVSSTSMSLVARIPGPTPPSQFITQLRDAITKNASALEGVRATRAEQQATRRLREEQNSAYERSLAQDRERARIKREAEASKQQEEKEAKEKAEAKEREQRLLNQWRRWRASQIMAEPGPDVKDAVRISVRLPSSERAVRKFSADAELEELYAFVECYELLQARDGIDLEKVEEPKGFTHVYKFRLVSTMPREAYELEDGGLIRERIGRSGNLIVESTVDEEEEEE
ncbi:MAG: hypothetical protein M1820_003505 [Bogoriella megaspora]|nr:MAG: hypothetical protein M1820_003505 [Bogoriella megaspora]